MEMYFISPSTWRLWIIFMGCFTLGYGFMTDVEVQLTGPTWVARGGSAVLRCLHQVPPELLYKVEFLKSGMKILQFVKERIPPFTNYSFDGGNVNMSVSSEMSITLDNLDHAASGTYWCEVSLETPIFTAASPPHQLTVVYPQKHPPIITFSDTNVVVGGLLRANCTSAPSAPAPTLTWYIDDIKVKDDSTKSYSYRVSSMTRTKGGGTHKLRKHRYMAPELNNTSKYWALVSDTTTKQPHQDKNKKCTLNDGQEDLGRLREKPRYRSQPPIQLWVSILELSVPAHGELRLICISTIPDQVPPDQLYADVKKQTVTVAVSEMKRPLSGAAIGSTETKWPPSRVFIFLLASMMAMSQKYYYKRLM